MPFETLELGIEHLSHQNLTAQPEEDNDFYLPLLGKRFASSDETTDLAHLMQDFTNNSNTKRICTLFGDGGAGKSTFLKQFTLKLWAEYTPDKPIPLFISLRLLNNPIQNAIEETLTSAGFSESQIAELKVRYSFIFIFDGYDELHQLTNLYRSNHLNEWNAKTIISCRTQYLYNKKNADLYFMPFNGEREQPQLWQTYYVAPFNQSQIKTYLETMRSRGALVPGYDEMITIPGLQELITTPFLLRLAIKALPEILTRNQSENIEECQRLTQTDLYKVFMEHWFVHQEKKLKDSGHITTDMPDQKPLFRQHCQKIALIMHENNLTWLDSKDSRFLVFFKNTPEAEQLRSACPLKITNGKLSFLHALLIIHLVGQRIYQEAAGEIALPVHEVGRMTISDVSTPTAVAQSVQERPVGEIYKCSITDNFDALSQWSDKVDRNPSYKTYLFDIIERSKINEYYAVGAANAISILNAARISFSGINLQRIRVCNADLSYANLDHALLDEADLSGVNLSNAWLNDASLTGANLKDVNFNEYPDLQFQKKVKHCCYSSDGLYLAAAAGERIFIYSTLDNKCVEILHFLGLIDISPGGLFKDYDEMRRNFYILDMQKINSLCFSPNGQYLVSGGMDPTIRLWRITSVQPNAITKSENFNEKSINKVLEENFIKSFQGHSGSVIKVIFSRDSQKIVSAGTDGSILVWNVSTSELICTLNKHAFIDELEDLRNDELAGPVLDIAMNTTAKYILSINWGKVGKEFSRLRFAYFWELESTKLIYKFSIGVNSAITAIAYSNNDQYISLGNDVGIIEIFFANTQKTYCLFRLSNGISAMTYKSDNQEIFISTYDNEIISFHLEAREIIYRFNGHINRINNITLHPNNHLMASSSDDGTIRFWKISQTAISQREKKIHNSINGLVFLPFQKIIISINIKTQEANHSIYKWGFNNGYIRTQLGFETRDEPLIIIPTIMACSPNEQLIATNSLFGACLWDIKTGQIVYRIACWELDEKGNEKYTISIGYHIDKEDPSNLRLNKAYARLYPDSYAGFTALSFDYTSTYLITAGIQYLIHVWDFQQRKLLHRFKGHTENITRIIVFSKKNTLLTSSYDGTIKIWSIETGKQSCFFTLESKKIFALALSPDEGIVVAGDLQGGVYFLSFSSGKLINQFFLTNNYAISFSFNETERVLAIGTVKQSVVLWDMVDNLILKEKTVATQSIAHVCVIWAQKDNQEFLITGSEDKAIRAWLLLREGLNIDLVLHSTTYQQALVSMGLKMEDAQVDYSNELLLKQRNVINKLLEVRDSSSDEGSNDDENDYDYDEETSNSGDATPQEFPTILMLKQVYRSHAGIFNASSTIFNSNNSSVAVEKMRERARNNVNGASAATIKYFEL